MGVLVMGFGNPMMGDDGAGPAVIDALLARGSLAPHRVEHGGTDVLTLPSLWHGEPSIWLVDAVAGSDPPGTIYRLGHHELLGIPQRTASCHHLSLPECLAWILHAHPHMQSVRFRLWGIEPAAVDFSPTLSEPVATAVLAAAEEIRGELRSPL